MSNLYIQELIDKLNDIYKNNGYVSEKIIFDEANNLNLSLSEIDFICEQLLSMGVIIQDTTDNFVESTDDTQDNYDRSQVNYDVIFKEVVSLDESLIPLIGEIRGIRAPQHREIHILMLQAKNGNEYAKKRIIEMYLRVVVKIALRYHKEYGYPLAEAIQDGALGLVIALEKYNKDEHGNFSTYASWWIRQVINREAQLPHINIYLPIYVKDKILPVINFIIKYNCGSLRMDANFLRIMSKKLNYSYKELLYYINLIRTVYSLDELVKNKEEIFSDKGRTIDNLIRILDNKRNLPKLLNSLTLKEKEVIMMRFGFYDGEICTLERIGEKFGVTRERIRQIETKAIKKLRYHINSSDYTNK